MRKFYRDNRNVIIKEGAEDERGKVLDSNGAFQTRSAPGKTLIRFIPTQGQHRDIIFLGGFADMREKIRAHVSHHL